MTRYLNVPLSAEDKKELKNGDFVYLTGTIYTARDAAHKRMSESLAKGEGLPFDIKDQIIYYMGPSPAREGRVIGSAGPTTAGRMDKYTPALLDLGLSYHVKMYLLLKMLLDQFDGRNLLCIKIPFSS